MDKQAAQVLVNEIHDEIKRAHGKEMHATPTLLLVAAKMTIEELLREVTVLDTTLALREAAPPAAARYEHIARPYPVGPEFLAWIREALDQHPGVWMSITGKARAKGDGCYELDELLVRKADAPPAALAVLPEPLPPTPDTMNLTDAQREVEDAFRRGWNSCRATVMQAQQPAALAVPADVEALAQRLESTETTDTDCIDAAAMLRSMAQQPAAAVPVTAAECDFIGYFLDLFEDSEPNALIAKRALEKIKAALGGGEIE